MTDVDTLTGWIALVLGEAGRLRAAGVLSLGGGGCTVTFAPLPIEAAPIGAVAGPDATVAAEGLDTLHDPHSYPGGVVPGYRIDRSFRAEIEEG